MESNKIFYEEKQFFSWSVVPLLLIVIFISIIYFLDIGDKKMSVSIYSIFLLLFLFIFLTTYNMKICIYKKYIIVSFGIGILKKKIVINELAEPIENVKIPWYYGVGFRFRKNSTLLNTRSGNSLRLNLLNGQKSIFIVSKDCKKMLETIKHLKKKNNYY